MRLSSRIDATSQRVQTAVTMKQVTGSMAGVVKSMDSALRSMNLEKVGIYYGELTSSPRWGWGEGAWWRNRQAEPRVQGGNHGNPAQPTTRTPVTLIISGELHSILTKGSGGRGNDRDRSAGNRSVVVAKQERMARNVLCSYNHLTSE